jgi:hypothetical protein
MPRKERLSHIKGSKHSPNESLITRINKAIEDVESGVSKKEACKSARVSRFGDSWQPSKMAAKQNHSARTYRMDPIALLAQNQVNRYQAVPVMSESTWTRAFKKSCGNKKIKCSCFLRL